MTLRISLVPSFALTAPGLPGAFNGHLPYPSSIPKEARFASPKPPFLFRVMFYGWPHVCLHRIFTTKKWEGGARGR